MTQNSWGQADDLRVRRLRPGYRLPRESVERNRRWRLLGSRVAVVAERGYEATTVSHVVEVSGVSRTAFYRLFANQEECFVAAVDEILEFAIGAIAEAWGRRVRGTSGCGRRPKPSSGLEPETPSLPWKCSTN
jgi:AcrR family transcriptional regulator